MIIVNVSVIIYDIISQKLLIYVLFYFFPEIIVKMYSWPLTTVSSYVKVLTP